MTPQQVVGLAVRLSSIWLALLSLGSLIGAVNNAREAHLMYGIGAVGIVIAVLLWVFPMFVAHKLIPRTKFNDVLHVPAHAAVNVACAIFSLWLFVDEILPRLAYYLALLMISTRSPVPLSDMKEFSLMRLIPLVIYIAVALFLALKPHKVSAFLLFNAADRDSEKTAKDEEDTL